MNTAVRQTIAWLSQVGVAEIDYIIDANDYVTYVSCYQPGIDRCLKLNQAQRLCIGEVVLYVRHNYPESTAYDQSVIFMGDLLAISRHEIFNQEQTT